MTNYIDCSKVEPLTQEQKLWNLAHWAEWIYVMSNQLSAYTASLQYKVELILEGKLPEEEKEQLRDDVNKMRGKISSLGMQIKTNTEYLFKN